MHLLLYVYEIDGFAKLDVSGLWNRQGGIRRDLLLAAASPHYALEEIVLAVSALHVLSSNIVI
jgi:hypothetical protein